MSITRLILVLLFFTGANLTAQSTEPRLIVGSVVACTDNMITVPVTTENFTDVIDMVFNLDWDVDSLELLDVTYQQQDALPLSYQYNATINKFSFASTDLISSPLSDATTLADGDTLLLLRFLVRARSTNQTIQSTFFPSLFSLLLFNDGGALAEADISIIPGGVFLETVCETEEPLESALNVGSITACYGDTVKVPVTVENFKNVVDMVFNLDWDISSLELIDVCYPQQAILPLDYQYNEQINKYSFASTDLVNSPLSDTTTLTDGDTLLLLQFVVLAQTADQTIQSTFFPSLFSLLLYSSNGNLTEADITINPGIVSVTEALIEFTLQPDTIDCMNFQAVLSVDTDEPAVTYGWFREGVLVGQGDEFITTEGGTLELVANSNTSCRTTLQIEVPVDTILARPQVQGEDISCRIATVLLEVVAPQVGYSYSWSNESNVLSTSTAFSTDTPGDYTLISVNGSNGCSDTTVVTVGADTLSPSFNVTISGALGCENEEVEIVVEPVAPENLCVWLFAGDSIFDCTLLVSLPGEYEALVTDTLNGCSSDTLVLLTDGDDPQAIAINVPSVLNCDGNPVILSVSDQESGEDYVWFEEDGSQIGQGRTLSVGSPGLYSVGVLGGVGVCSRTGVVEVFADTIAPSVVLAAAEITCSLPSVDLSFTSSTPNLTVVWTTTDDTPLTTPSVQDPGIYRVIVTNPLNGCTTIDSLRVESNATPPVYAVSEQGQVTLDCRQDRQTVAVIYDGNYSIAWSDQPGTIIATTDSILVAAVGEVLLVVTNDENGCKDSTRLSVIIDESVPEVEIRAPAAFSCEQNGVFLEVMNTPSFHYEWSHLNGGLVTAVSTDSFLVNLPGTLVLTTTDVLTGCQSVDTITIAPGGDELSFFGLSVDLPPCGSPMNASVMLGQGGGGVGPYTYAFVDQTYLPFEIIEDLDPGSYQLRLTDNTTCFKDTNIVIGITRPLQFTIIGGNQEIQLGDFIELSLLGDFDLAFTYNIDWITADTICMGCEVLRLQPLRSGDFSVNILRSDGCSLTLTGRFIVDRRPDIYLPTAFSPNEDGINEFYLPLYGPQVDQIVEFTVHGRWGEILYSYTNENIDLSDGWDGTSKGEPLLPGVYVASVSFRLVDGTLHTISQSFNLLR